MVISICKHVKHNIDSLSLQDFMKNCHFNITLTKMIIICNKQIKRVWINVPTQHVILDQYMFIGHIINPYILHLNYQIMFPILYCLIFFVFCPSHICFNIQSPQNNLWRTPKLLDGLNYESKGEDNERKRSWVHSLAHSTSRVQRHVKVLGWD